MAKRQCDPTSGSIGSQTYMVGRNGQVVRARVIPANPNTIHQATVRANLATASKAYDALTQAQQLAWIAAGANQQTRAVLGMSGPLTGNQLFVRVNANLLELGQDQVTAPPPIPVIPALVPQTLSITNTAGVIAIKLACPDDPGDGTVILAAPPVKTGVHRVPQMVNIGTCPAPAQGSADITSLYAARFGAPTVGSKVFIGAYLMVDGYDGPRKSFSQLVPAAS